MDVSEHKLNGIKFLKSYRSLGYFTFALNNTVHCEDEKWHLQKTKPLKLLFLPAAGAGIKLQNTAQDI